MTEPKSYLARERPFVDAFCEHGCRTDFEHLVRQLDEARSAIKGMTLTRGKDDDDLDVDVAPIEQLDKVAALNLALMDLSHHVPHVMAWCITCREIDNRTSENRVHRSLGFKTREQAEANLDIARKAHQRGRKPWWPKIEVVVELAPIAINCVIAPDGDVAYATRGWGT